MTFTKNMLASWVEKSWEKYSVNKTLRSISERLLTLKFDKASSQSTLNKNVSVKKNLLYNNYFMLTEQPEISLILFLTFLTCCHDSKSVPYTLGVYILSTCKVKVTLTSKLFYCPIWKNF